MKMPTKSANFPECMLSLRVLLTIKEFPKAAGVEFTVTFSETLF
jgi:hypothetical protein